MTTTKQIAVLERGFVYVGDVAREGDFIVISNASNVRRWGTQNGLGQLASQGPQPQTKLDPAGKVRAPMATLIHLIDCNAAVWPANATAGA